MFRVNRCYVRLFICKLNTLILPNYWRNRLGLIISRFSTRVEISNRYTVIKIPNFPYNWLFFKHGMKYWYYTRVNPLFLKNKDADFTSMFLMDRWKIYHLIKCLHEFDGSYIKFSFLNTDSFQWLQGFEVIIAI